MPPRMGSLGPHTRDPNPTPMFDSLKIWVPLTIFGGPWESLGVLESQGHGNQPPNAKRGPRSKDANDDEKQPGQNLIGMW